jgi:hypothetical protein
MYISTVEVSETYVQGCDTGILKDDEFFLVRRSKVWDLSDSNQRLEAAIAFLSCLNYTMNG